MSVTVQLFTSSNSQSEMFIGVRLHLYSLQDMVKNEENHGQEAVVEEDASSTNGAVIINSNEDEEELGAKNGNSSPP